MRRRALRPLVEVLEASDDAIYLLRGGADGDCVIREPVPAVREIVRALQAPRSPEEVMACCRAAGVEAGAGTVRDAIAALDAEGLLEPVGSDGRLAPVDRERFDRQLLYLRQAGAGDELQARLRAASVVVIGCGGLGSWAAWSVACLGVGSLTLVDFDAVELANLNRQLLFGTGDIGRAKCEVAAERLSGFDPGMRVDALRERIEGPEDVARLARGADVVLACADWPPYDIARWIDEGCRRAGVPHVSAGQLPPVVRVGPFVSPGVTPCVRCLERQLRAENPLYDELEAMRKRDPRPAATLGPACGLVGSMLALDVLGWLTGLHEPATWGTAIAIDMRTMEPTRTPIAADPDCPCGAARR